MKGETLVAAWTLLFTANSTDTSHSGQSFCLWSTKNQRYYSSSWFIHSICLSICGWNTVNSFFSIPSILFNSFINYNAKWGPLSDTTLSGNPCNFHTLFLNNLANPSIDVSSMVATKYVIFDNQLQTTRITSFPAITSNFVMNSTIRYVYSSSGTSLNFSFQLSPPSYSSSSATNCTLLHIFPCLLSLLATNNS